MMHRVRFKSDELNKFAMPCVYQFMLEGTPLYVGVSALGIARVFTADQMQNRMDARQLCDEVIIKFFDSDAEASEEETTLIHDFHPRYNRQCQVSGCRYYCVPPRAKPPKPPQPRRGIGSRLAETRMILGYG